MIGINDSNQVKVWCNKQFYLEGPRSSYSIVKTATMKTAEQNMVKEIQQICLDKVALDTAP